MPVAVKSEISDDDAFSAAFAALTSGAEPVAVDPAEPVAVDPAEPVAVDPAEPVAVDPVEPVAVDPAEPVAADPAPVDTSTNDDMLRRLAALVKEPPAPAPAPAAPVELFTAEEKTLLAAYDKDWPDVARAEAIRIRAAQVEVVDHMNRQFTEVLKPLMETVRELSAQKQYNELEAAEPQYADIRDKTIAWARSQPSYLRPSFERVIEQGTVEEVTHLIAMYRQATGDTAIQNLAPAPASNPAPAELPAAVKKAVVALAPVRSARSGPVAEGVDKNDFDGAFTLASKMKFS